MLQLSHLLAHFSQYPGRLYPLYRVVPELEYLPKLDQIYRRAFVSEARRRGRSSGVYPTSNDSHHKHDLSTNLPGLHAQEAN